MAKESIQAIKEALLTVTDATDETMGTSPVSQRKRMATF